MNRSSSVIERADALIFLAIAMFATSPLFLRLLPAIPIPAFLLSFQVVGGLTLLVVTRRSFWACRQHWRLLLFLSLVCVLHDLCNFAAYRMTSVSNAAIAQQTVSFFLIFMSPLVTGDSVRRDELKALAISVIGLVALYSDGISADSVRDLEGISLGILSGFLYATLICCYVVIGKRKLSVPIANTWRYLMSIAMVLPLMFFSSSSSTSVTNILWLIGFGLLFAVVASNIHTYGISKSRPLHASIIGKAQPVFASVFALMILDEVPSASTIAGGALILGASIWLAFRSEAPGRAVSKSKIPQAAREEMSAH